MRPGFFKAFATGILILLFTDFIWYWLLPVMTGFGGAMSLMGLWWVGTALAGFVTARLAPTRKIELAVLLGIPAAILLGLTNYVYEKAGGGVDFHGVHRALVLAEITFIWG